MVTAALASAGLYAQTRGTVNVYVKESAGIRRTSYPVNVRIPFPQGALLDFGNTRLMNGEMETPAQIAAESRWRDGSIRWLEADFNVSIGPMESQTYRLEYGGDVKAAAVVRGLTVTENDGIEVGHVRFNKSGAPLLASVKYRGEDIGRGANGLIVTDAAGTEHDLANADGLKAEIVKRGPLYVVIRYSGTIAIDGSYRVPFVLTVEMPNSKSWVKMTAAVEDPGKRLREVSFHTPLALGPLPWVWDFGTEHWTYGALRNPGDTVQLSEVVKTSGTNAWKVTMTSNGQEQPYETGVADRSKVIRWAHLQNSNEVIAFVMETGGSPSGTYVIRLAGDGQTSFHFAPALPRAQHHLTLYEHYVAPPVHIGAATSPSSVLNPLSAVCDTKQYTAAGVPAPR
ncbi:MAG: hypothetical protein C5B51_01440 [Terriglobia bacterium]|nr:MAG: hypothetical protein C5B51_01440 [Terriglobia bacterium]